MKKKALSLALALALVLALIPAALAAETTELTVWGPVSGDTFTFDVSNVNSQGTTPVELEDFDGSTYTREYDVLYCASPVTVTLQQETYALLGVRVGEIGADDTWTRLLDYDYETGEYVFESEIAWKPIWGEDTGGYRPILAGTSITITKPGEYNIRAQDAGFYIVVEGNSAPNLDTAATWARPHIESALSKGFIPEDIQNNYSNVITRQEFCRMAVKWVEYALEKPIDEIVKERGIPDRMGLSFSDTSDASILAAYQLGITAGSVAPTADKPGQFNPNGQFTRQEAAVMIMNTCKAIGADVTGSPDADFADLYATQTASWARPGISFVRANRIMNGDGTNFNAQGLYSRQESITTFNNIKHNELPGR